MEAAKEAISKLTSKHGKHTTDVTEHYNPAVTHEQINPTREHQTTEVVDKEIHQDHHHTSVLPIQDKQVLPTEHSHNIVAAKHTEHHHGDHQGIKDKIAGEIAQFKDHSQTAPTEKTHTAAPTVGSEHHHHHVHETIQPVIQKQTIQPSVVHTTVPVHETHHTEPKHYTASSLPAVSMQEFKSQGGSVTGLADRVERFEGEPQNIAKHGLGHSGTSSTTTGTSTSHGLSGTGSNTTGTSDVGQSGYSSTGLNDTSRNTQTGTTGMGTTGMGTTGMGTTGMGTTGMGTSSHGTTGLGTSNHGTTGLTDNTRSGTTGTGTSGMTGTTGSGTSALGSGNNYSSAQQTIDSRVDKPGHSGIGHNTTSSGLGSTSNTTHGSGTTTKPSLLDRMNPFKDADGDGKKGMGS